MWRNDVGQSHRGIECTIFCCSPPALVTLLVLETQRPDPEVDSLVFKMLQILFTFQVMPLSFE